ncbi:MAG: hypothetical protein U0992_04880 [Planctomycetaceae bacterium]
MSHPFWFLLMIACLVPYSTITVYVAIRGSFDIRHMLDRLKENAAEESGREDSEPLRQLTSRYSMRKRSKPVRPERPEPDEGHYPRVCCGFAVSLSGW